MTRRKKIIVIGIGFVLTILLLPFLIFKDRTIQDNEEELSTMVIYTPNTDSLLATVIPVFEQMHKVKVQLVQDSTGELFNRLEAKEIEEQADIMFGGSSLWYASNSSLFIPYQSILTQDIDEIYLSSDYSYTPYSIEGSVILVNNQLTQGLQIQSYEDLLQNNLKEKIGIADPLSASAAFSQLVNILLAKGGYQNSDAWNYIEKLFINQKPKIYQESSEVNQGLKQGSIAVGLSTEAVAYQLINEGAPLDIVYPYEGILYLPSAVAIVKGTENEMLAKKFIDFLLSPSVQMSLSTGLYQRPILPKYNESSSLKDMEDIHHLNDEAEEILEYQDNIRQNFYHLKENAK